MPSNNVFKNSLRRLKDSGLDSVENIHLLHTHDGNEFGGHLHIAIEIADSNNFLSEKILQAFFDNIEFAWSLANVFKHLKTADLLPDIKLKDSELNISTQNIFKNLDDDLKNRTYLAVMQNLQNLHDLELQLRYLAMNGLLKNNINQVFRTIQHANAIAIALHNLNGSHYVNQPALDKLYADPQHAGEIAAEIIKTGSIYQDEKKIPLAGIQHEAPKPAVTYQKPPKIYIRRGR